MYVTISSDIVDRMSQKSDQTKGMTATNLTREALEATFSTAVAAASGPQHQVSPTDTGTETRLSVVGQNDHVF